MSKFNAKIKSTKMMDIDAKMIENDVRKGVQSYVFLVIVARGKPCKNTVFSIGFQCFSKVDKIEQV